MLEKRRIHPFWAVPGPIAIADLVRANVPPSLDAIRGAIERGFGYMALNVRATNGRVELVSRTPIPPSLEQALEEFPDARFCIEFRDDPTVSALVELAGRRGAWSRLAFDSPSQPLTDRFRGLSIRRGVWACTAMGPRQAVPARTSAHRMQTGGAAFVQTYEFRDGTLIVDKPFVDAARRARLPVIVRHVPEERIDPLIDLGVHGLRSQDAEALSDAFARRGLPLAPDG